MEGQDSLIKRFYRHSNDQSEILCDSLSELGIVIGPNLQSAFDVLKNEGLMLRESHYEKKGGWSGDLEEISKRLFRFQNETCILMGDSGSGGNLVANVYDITMNSTQGWSQYISVVLSGEFNPEVDEKFYEVDYAPKNTYLAKNDPCVTSSFKKYNKVWFDKLSKINSPFD